MHCCLQRVRVGAMKAELQWSSLSGCHYRLLPRSHEVSLDTWVQPPLGSYFLSCQPQLASIQQGTIPKPSSFPPDQIVKSLSGPFPCWKSIHKSDRAVPSLVSISQSCHSRCCLSESVLAESPGNYRLGLLAISGSSDEDMSIRIMGLREGWEVGMGSTAESLIDWKARRVGMQGPESIVFCWSSDHTFFSLLSEGIMVSRFTNPLQAPFPMEWKQTLSLQGSYSVGVWGGAVAESGQLWLLQPLLWLGGWSGGCAQVQMCFPAVRSRAAPAVNAPEISCP